MITCVIYIDDENIAGVIRPVICILRHVL